LKVHVDSKGKVLKVIGDPENPITNNFLCPRTIRDNEYVYKNRALYPHIRIGNKPSNSFKRISWEEALNIIADKLMEVIKEHGSKAVLHLEYAGNMGLLTWYFPLRLWNAIGATGTDYTICSASGHEAISLHYGSSYGALPEEIEKAKLIVFWGFNAAVSSIHLWRLALKARKEGRAKIAVIDSRVSESAERADIFLQPRPGSDVALAYGISKYLIEKGYIDEKFISKYTYGFEEFKREALKWSIKTLEKITNVPWCKIEAIGEAYGKLRPSLTLIGFGIQKSIYGAEAVRAISLIPALLGIHRGFYYSNSRGWSIDIKYLTGECFLKRKTPIVSQVRLAKLIEEGRFKFIYIYNMNPLLTLPDQQSLRKGLIRNDVFVVLHEVRWTETARYSDIVLPAPSYLEKDDVVISYSHRYVRLSRKAIEPLGESKDEIWVMRNLAKKLGIRKEWIYEDPWEALRKALSNAFENGSFEDLVKGKVLKLKYKPKNKYQTPSGRIEFYSLKAKSHGINPLPQQEPLNLSQNEFILLNSATLNYTHTQFTEIYGPIPPIAYINTQDAKRLGIKSGDLIVLENNLGKILVKAEVTEKVMEKTVWMPRQLVDANGVPQNILVPSKTQNIGNGPIFNSTRVKIRKFS